MLRTNNCYRQHEGMLALMNGIEDKLTATPDKANAQSPHQLHLQPTGKLKSHLTQKDRSLVPSGA